MTSYPGVQNLHSPAFKRVKQGATAVSSGTFWLYMYFLVDFFLHLSQRIPGYGVLRPTLLLVLMLSASLYLQRDKLKEITKDPIFKALIAVLIYIAVTLPLVEWPGSVLRGGISEFVKAIVFLFFTALIVDSDRRLRIFLVVFVVCQVFRVLEPLYMNITDGYLGSRTYLGGGDFSGRLAGAPADVVNPNGLGFVLVTAIPFLHYLLWTRGLGSKVLYLALMPAMFYALILTMSRGGFIALLVVAWMVFKESKHKLFLIGLAVIIAMAGWSVMSPIQKERYLSLVDEDAKGGTSVQGRFDGMIQEFELGLERPVVGHGLGTTQEAKFHSFGGGQVSHNFYAELIIELGIIGMAIFIRFIFKIYQRFQENRRLIQQENSCPVFYLNLNKALIALFWMYLIYSINYWGLSQYYWYLFGGLAIAFGRQLDRIAKENAADEAPAEKSEGGAVGLPGRQSSLRERSRDWARVMR